MSGTEDVDCAPSGSGFELEEFEECSREGEGVRRSDLSLTPGMEEEVNIVDDIAATLPERGIMEDDAPGEEEKGGAAATISARVKCGLLNMGHSRFVFM